MEGDAQRQDPRRRRRAARSCVECRRREIKCDRTNPCRHCISTGIQCTYKAYRNAPAIQSQPLQGTLSTPVHGSLPTAGDQVDTTERIVEHLSRSLAHNTSTTWLPTPTTVDRVKSPSSDRIAVLEEDLRILMRRMQKLEESSSANNHLSLPEARSNGLVRPSKLQDIETSTKKSRISKGSHWLVLPQEFATLIAFFKETAAFKQIDKTNNNNSFQTDDIRPLVVETTHLLHRCKALARELKIGRPTRRVSMSGLHIQPPPRVMADATSQLYFEYFESTYRVLHVPSFWNDYEHYWDDPDNARTELRLKVLLVIAIGWGLVDHEYNERDFREKAHEWIFAAQSWLSGPLEKDRLTVTGVQIYCLTVLARQIHSLGGELTWTSVGSLVHRAIQIGLHRDPKYLPTMSILQAEIRRRLWATIIEMAVQSSLDSEMPPRISIDEFDTMPPSNVNDDDLEESSTSIQPHPKGQHTMTSVQLALLDSWRTRLEISRLLYGLSFDIAYADALTLNSDLMRALGQIRIGRPEDASPDFTTFHSNMLDYMVRRFLVHLHIPFSCRASIDLRFYYSRKTSVDAAIAITSPEPDERFSRLMKIGCDLFKTGIRYASVAICLELLAQTQAYKTDPNLHRASDYRVALKLALENILELSAERIRYGELNVKGYLFVDLVLAEVKSIQDNTSTEFEIAYSSQNSLQFCYDLLRAQANFPSASNKGADGTAFEPDLGNFAWDLNFDFGFNMETFMQDTQI